MIRKIGYSVNVALSPDQCSPYGHLILPGVGSFDYGVNRLLESGFKDYLINSQYSPSRLLVGICLGMQLLFDSSEEGSSEGLSLIPGRVVRFNPSSTNIKVPHMGWNVTSASPIFPQYKQVLDGTRFYFVHSFHVECQNHLILSTTTHGIEFPSSVLSGHILGFQFHPEKSHVNGMNLLRFVLPNSSHA